MFLQPEDALKILLAVAAGGLIGLEREFRDKAAGFRTLILICTGAAVFTILSSGLAGDKDPTRIAAQIVTGVGFLGAGVIVRDAGRVIGLTTAAAIWLTAALGMALGGGYYAVAGFALGAVLVVLWLFPRVEHWVEAVSETVTLEVVCVPRPEKLDELDQLLRRHGLRPKPRGRAKTPEAVTAHWEVQGSPQQHARLAQSLFQDAEVREFHLSHRVAG
ncbi:MAG: MgtC/SapB family protein [Anaerolineales bacterium]|nr:MgtC/SapB family protein [Anaerolineales bacterium]